jgi:hypothetical protein
MTRKNKILGVLLMSAVPALANASPTPPDDKAPKALLALRRDLVQVGRQAALADMPRFRALCDADGYPLVGNLGNKTNVYQPSQFCADVRKAGK